MTTAKLVILDRDGVINADSDDYIKSPEEWRLLPGSADAIALFNRNGYGVAVASNQSGVARGLFDEAMLERIHEKMKTELAAAGAHIDYLVYCPHGPDDECQCRKPKPGMLHQVADHFNVSLHKVPVIGDSLRDLKAAEAVHAHGILVLTGKGQSTFEQGVPDTVPVFDDLLTAAKAVTHE